MLYERSQPYLRQICVAANILLNEHIALIVVLIDTRGRTMFVFEKTQVYNTNRKLNRTDCVYNVICHLLDARILAYNQRLTRGRVQGLRRDPRGAVGRGLEATCRGRADQGGDAQNDRSNRDHGDDWRENAGSCCRSRNRKEIDIINNTTPRRYRVPGDELTITPCLNGRRVKTAPSTTLFSSE